MKLKDFKIKIEKYSPSLDVAVMETKKHDDNAPLMKVIDVERSCDNHGNPYIVIYIDPNPDTIIPKEITEEEDFKSSIDELSELYEESKDLMIRLVPPEQFGEDENAERLYNILKELRDKVAVGLQKIHNVKVK